MIVEVKTSQKQYDSGRTKESVKDEVSVTDKGALFYWLLPVKQEKYI